MYYYPPAVSDFDLPRVLQQVLANGAQRGSLNDALCQAIGCRAAASGTSWVMMLVLLLKHLKEQRSGSEVVLTGYSCNEFTKATLLAGLQPVYVEVNEDLTANIEHTRVAITDDTLAVFAINNVGVESNNPALARLCREHDVACIEDATYTYLGHSERYDAPFGSFGDFAILNFSEGKIIPVGGGAVLLNSERYDDVFERVKGEVHQRKPASEPKELLDLFVYKAGSSKTGYTAYRHLQAAGGGDLKQKLSMEPTRSGMEDVGLVRNGNGEIVMPPERKRALLRNAQPRPLGLMKQLCGMNVIENIERYCQAKRAKYERLASGIANMPHVEGLPLPTQGIPVRMPVVIEPELSEHQFARLNRLGVDRHYITAYPMYGDPARPNANRFYEKLYTLPLHRYAPVGALVKAFEKLGGEV